MSLAGTARIWTQAGVSCIPIQANQTKRPAVRWGDYQVKAPELGQVDEWWGNGSTYGIALICGAVSGGLEMVELEGRAASADMVTEVVNRCDELGIGHIWDLLNGPEGYSEMSPSGGLHLLYRITDHEVPGNTKIAQNEEGLVLAETRGEGGYVIVAPTPGICHPTGEAWVKINGAFGQLPQVTWAERCQLHKAIQQALDKSDPAPPVPAISTTMAPAAFPSVPPFPGSSAAGLTSPGDDLDVKVSWRDILEPHGWRVESTRGTEVHWTRPGKDPRQGSSATTGYAQDRDRFFVFTTSTLFTALTPYTKFAVYTLLNHGGDYSAAAAELRRQGYGDARPESDLKALDLWAPGDQDEGPTYNRCEANDVGNTQQLYQRVKDRFHFLAEEKDFICWDGVKWSADQRFVIEHEFNTMTRELAQQARAAGDETWVKWWIKAGNRPRIEAAIKGLRGVPGFTVTFAELNDDRRVINVRNGILDLGLSATALQPHDPGRKMTRVMGTHYDPEATCPKFDGFMERVLPDPEMRSYVQRALGYSMLGDADQRSLFLVCGPSGTGKSTLMATMELVFGDYGVPAPSGTLRAAGREGSSPSNDLHMLQGKRFVSTSETNEHTAFNEDLIKRLTGRDLIQSRKLYQDFQGWSPVCAIWLATNHPPKFSSDDDAIWRRAKIIPFHTVLLGEGEVRDYAHNVLALEKAGILNWLLAGLRDYLANGLQEPGEVKEMAHEVRLQSDPVSRFLEDHFGDGILIRDPLQQIRTAELYTMYQEWARRLGERTLGSRRFTNRVLSGYPDITNARVQGNYFWRGLGKATGVSVLGTFHQVGAD